jgi:hypothetical protein
MTQNTHTARAQKTKRNLIWGAVIAVVAVLTVGASIAYALANQPEPKPQATQQPTPVITPPSTPSVAPTPTPVAVEPTIALPNDCRKIYTAAFLELWAGEPLNDPALADVVISRYETVEKLRESLPGIECKWGKPTEGGMSNAVNRVMPDQESALIAAATAEGFDCVERGVESATLCAIAIGPSDDDEWVVAEELYFRDGLVVTTWRASTTGSIADSSQPVYDTLWP